MWGFWETHRAADGVTSLGIWMTCFTITFLPVQHLSIREGGCDSQAVNLRAPEGLLPIPHACPHSTCPLCGIRGSPPLGLSAEQGFSCAQGEP